MNKKCRVNEYGEMFLGDYLVSFAVCETGHRNPFYEVKMYDNEEDYSRDLPIMTSAFSLKKKALRECKRLNRFCEAHPTMVKTAGERGEQQYGQKEKSVCQLKGVRHSAHEARNHE